MIITNFSLFISLFLSLSLPLHSTPYLSPTTIFPNYKNMLQSFKIFTYIPRRPLIFSTPAESLFFSTLLNSSFITQDPEQAHLFFIPFSSKNISTRSLSRLVNGLRYDFPFWNRTLGADHFYVACEGFSFVSDRNVLELKKNSVQISCFPIARDKFVPHKDITLPPLADNHAPNLTIRLNMAKRYLGYVRYGAVKGQNLIKELSDDSEFLVDSRPLALGELTYEEKLSTSKFCLFDYGDGDVSGISDAVRFGCVPVVITERTIQDLPLMDLLKWQDMSMFMGWNKAGFKVEELKRALNHTCGDERYEEVRGLCMKTGKHFSWNEQPQPYDAFHMVMYQLWLRRHTIRYARREVA